MQASIYYLFRLHQLVSPPPNFDIKSTPGSYRFLLVPAERMEIKSILILMQSQAVLNLRDTSLPWDCNAD